MEGIGDKVTALLRLRCGNMERENRYWILEEEHKTCVFCEKGLDNRTLYRRLHRNKRLVCRFRKKCK